MISVVNEMRSRVISILLLLCMVWWSVGCGGRNTALSDAEADAINEICGIDAAGFKDISREVITKERADKFPAAAKVYRKDNLYAFILKPIAYNGPISLALVIDGDHDVSIGVRIVEHVETPHYVRDMENKWFIDRFADKNAGEYLSLVRLQARNEHEVVAITGATVTTEAVINGVNAAFGIYQEYVLGQTAENVPYMVRFEPGQGDGPVETESLAIRAYGVILAEISLEEIRALPSVKRTMSIHSTAGISQHSFRGALMSDVLGIVDPEIVEQYLRILAVGVDDYISGISMEEVRGENNVYVMYEDNDLPLLKKNGEPGGMRVVVINDIFGQRFTNYLLEIVLESEVSP